MMHFTATKAKTACGASTRMPALATTNPAKVTCDQCLKSAKYKKAINAG